LINPFWVEDSKGLGRGEIDYLSGGEVQFWKDLIDKYLHPIDADSKKQVQYKVLKSRSINPFHFFVFSFQTKIQNELKELRNKSVFFFCVFNALFVLIVFMLTLHKDTLYIDWPFGVKENITVLETGQVRGNFDFVIVA